MNKIGTLYICPTPIGNLKDITIRVLETLKTVDVIACEDTRHTIKLLNNYNISKPLISYYEHNKNFKGRLLIEKLINGESIALVSDAGTPLISDPGFELILSCIENNIKVESLPGPCAMITALTLSGQDSYRFSFEGFLPVNKKNKLNRLNEIKNDKRTLVFYEAPHKLITTLKDFLLIFGDRKIVLAREITKKFEENIRTTIKEALNLFEQKIPKGEFVLIVEGAKNCDEAAEKFWESLSINEHYDFYVTEGKNNKEAIKQVATDRNLPKREIYNLINKK